MRSTTNGCCECEGRLKAGLGDVFDAADPLSGARTGAADALSPWADAADALSVVGGARGSLESLGSIQY